MRQGIRRMAVRVLRAEDAGCESGYLEDDIRVLWSEEAGCQSEYFDDDSQGAEGKGFWM